MQDAAAQTPFLAAISKSIAVGCLRWAHRASLRIHELCAAIPSLKARTGVRSLALIIRSDDERGDKHQTPSRHANKASHSCGQIATFRFCPLRPGYRLWGSLPRLLECDRRFPGLHNLD